MQKRGKRESHLKFKIRGNTNTVVLGYKKEEEREPWIEIFGGENHWIRISVAISKATKPCLGKCDIERTIIETQES